MGFSEDELKTLKAFFEQYYQEFKDSYLSSYGVKCIAEESNTLFYCSWSDLAMGWHDESWRDNATITVKKEPVFSPQKDVGADDPCSGRIQAIIKEAESFLIIKHVHESDWRYDKDETLLLVKGFLGIPGWLRILFLCSYGEW